MKFFTRRMIIKDFAFFGNQENYSTGMIFSNSLITFNILFSVNCKVDKKLFNSGRSCLERALLSSPLEIFRLESKCLPSESNWNIFFISSNFETSCPTFESWGSPSRPVA